VLSLGRGFGVPDTSYLNGKIFDFALYESALSNSQINAIYEDKKCSACLQAFIYDATGSDQTFTVPAGVDRISVEAWGAGGADGCWQYAGGAGGYASAIIDVSPGDQFMVGVGQTSEFPTHASLARIPGYSPCSGYTFYMPGHGGNGSHGCSGAGGGMSGLFKYESGTHDTGLGVNTPNSCLFQNLLVHAGGGGGAGGSGIIEGAGGGGGGGLAGSSGQRYSGDNEGGDGGDSVGQESTNNTAHGGQFQNGTTNGNNSGGGGGAGLEAGFGGEGLDSWDSSGGGGSGLVNGLPDSVLITGARGSKGLTRALPHHNSNRGGAGEGNADGRVVICALAAPTPTPTPPAPTPTPTPATPTPTPDPREQVMCVSGITGQYSIFNGTYDPWTRNAAGGWRPYWKARYLGPYAGQFSAQNLPFIYWGQHLPSQTTWGWKIGSGIPLYSYELSTPGTEMDPWSATWNSAISFTAGECPLTPTP